MTRWMIADEQRRTFSHNNECRLVHLTINLMRKADSVLSSHTIKTKNILTFAEPGPSLDISVHKSGFARHSLVSRCDTNFHWFTPTRTLSYYLYWYAEFK